MYSRKQLAQGFRTLGVIPGDTVMLHASVRAAGPLAGGPDDIHLALKDALGPEGTLMMYAGCPQFYDEVGRGVHAPELEEEILAKLPPFDALTARSARDNGSLVECLRTYPGSRVSHHIARFVARGKQADHIVAAQPWDYAYGAGSPMDRFLQMNGKILLFGSDHDAVTFLHYAEHVGDFPGKIVVRYQVPIEEDGHRAWRLMEEFDTSERAHANWPGRFFAKIVDSYLLNASNGGGKVGDASCYLFPARDLMAFAIPIMQAVAADARAAGELREMA